MKVVILGDEVLRQKAEPLENIDDDFRSLVKDMFETMDNENGVGLAAPQIGISKRFFCIKSDDGIERVFVNPQIMETSQETCSYEEGCLSIPGEFEEIERPKRVKIQAFDEYGKSFVLDEDGFLARIIQHEFDHLQGVLYIDRGDDDFKNKIIDKFEKRNKRRAEKAKVKAQKAARIEAKKKSALEKKAGK